VERTTAHRPFRAGFSHAIGALALVALLGTGAAGAIRYGVTFWRYRGFAPPAAPKTVTVTVGHRKVRRTVPTATVERLALPAPSLGGWLDRTFVVLPPGYRSHPTQRYPVLYLLHGSPGESTGLLDALGFLPTYETLLAEGRIRPIIVVLPDGARGFFGDTEWANGIRPDSGWETFVAATLVDDIDHRFRAIDAGWARGIAGLSEGGYGALNIGLHHSGEFHLIESWSGYATADHITAIFGTSERRLAYNSPIDQLPRLASTLRARHDYIWAYIGSDDSLLDNNLRLAAVLRSLRIPHRFQVLPGGHSWDLWRAMLPEALETASARLVPPAQGRHHDHRERASSHPRPAGQPA
jgi:enterochelin esterase-like enzyme